MKKEIYLDNAAATPADPAVVRAVADAMRIVGNPSSFNDAGRVAGKALAGARAQVASFLNARADEVIFCASGSEANNLALSVGGQVVTQPTEHLSVLVAAGNRARMVPVDAQGRVSVDVAAQAITKHTRVVSIMYANNEIGTIQPIKKIATAIRSWRKAHGTAYPYLHVDACQAAGCLDMDVQRLGVDLMTFNGSKVYGPRGVAVLYVRRGVPVVGAVLGGSQESGRRAGTENVAGAVGLARALRLIKPADADRVAKLRDYFLAGLAKVVPDARINGPLGDGRLANNINFSIPGADSESLLLELDRHGIRAGSGSACTAHAVEPSHVLKAIGTPKKYLDGALRLSLSRQTTKADIAYVMQVLPAVVTAARARNLK